MSSTTGILALLAAAAAAGCVGPFGARRAREADVAAVSDTAPVIRIREFDGSARTSVLAWAHGEARVGLRAEVRRDDGGVTGSFQRGDHTLFIGTAYVATMGGFTRATVPPRRLVLKTAQGHDDLACWRAGRAQCSPLTAVHLSIPDSVLRAPGDSVVVALHSDWANPWTVSLRRDLVDAYLHTVDSVSAARRAPVSAR